MAATYGYGGEFSSDEDIDRMEQQSEAFTSNKLTAQELAKPSKQKIEEIIDNIRRIPADQDIQLSDDYLVGLLDYYRIQRGPVVDSTRKLYKRIALKRIRDGEQTPASNGDANKGLNGNADNNNTINIISKRLQSVAQVEPASSDDDEPMPPASSQSSVEQSQNRGKFDSRVAYTLDKPEPMEVDTAAPVTPASIGEIRTSKQVDISSSEDESEDESKSGDSSDSEELDITPLKSPPSQQVGSAALTTAVASSKIIASTPIKDSATKHPPVTPKDAVKNKTTKTPQYTRSQRVATRSSSSTSTNKSTTASKKIADVSSSKSDESQQIAQVKSLNKSMLASFENCSRGLSKMKLNPPFRLSVVEDENGEIAFGSTINGRKLNYAEKMVLMVMQQQARKNKKPASKRNST